MASGTIQTSSWKKHGEFDRNELFNLPSNYTELLVVVYGGSGNVYSQVIPKESLGSEQIGHIIGGYYYTNINYGLVNVYMSKTQGKLMSMFDGGADKLSTSRTSIYYK